MPKRLRHIHGTKERPLGRQCIIFRLQGGPVLVDRVHPDDRDEMLARLNGHYGPGSVTVYSRDMGKHEQYISLDQAVA